MNLIALALLSASLAQQQPAPVQDTSVTPSWIGTVNVSTCPSFMIMKSGTSTDFAVKIDCKGNVEFGKDVTPNEAAKEFAREVTKLWPEVCGK